MGLLCANGKDSWSSYRDDARVGLRAVCKLTKFLGRSPDTAIVEVLAARISPCATEDAYRSRPRLLWCLIAAVPVTPKPKRIRQSIQVRRYAAS